MHAFPPRKYFLSNRDFEFDFVHCLFAEGYETHHSRKITKHSYGVNCAYKSVEGRKEGQFTVKSSRLTFVS